MKLLSMKCPECGAILDIPDDRKTFFCTYCGNKILLDDGSHTVTHIHIDQTREKELLYEEKRRAHEQKKANTEERGKMIPIVFVSAAIVSVTVALLLIKDDFNIMFNFCVLVVGCITAVFRTIKKMSSAVNCPSLCGQYKNTPM
jgi:DNA-directed RNA polymerase subunit RPC12/RpoP